MSVFVVTYDLKNANAERYDDIHQKIIETGLEVARIQYSVFLVSSSLTAKQIKLHIQTTLTLEDNLFVARLYPDVSGLHDFNEEIQKWLNKNL